MCGVHTKAQCSPSMGHYQSVLVQVMNTPVVWLLLIHCYLLKLEVY